MNTQVKIPKIYTLLTAVSITTIAILGSQLLLKQQIAAQQEQTNNPSSTAPSPTSNNNSSSSSVSIPLSKGYVNGKIAFFIATDASDSRVAASMTNTTGFNVNFA